MFHREHTIKEKPKVTNNICQFNGTVWAKVEDSVKHVSGGCWVAV